MARGLRKERGAKASGHSQDNLWLHSPVMCALLGITLAATANSQTATTSCLRFQGKLTDLLVNDPRPVEGANKVAVGDVIRGQILVDLTKPLGQNASLDGSVERQGATVFGPIKSMSGVAQGVRNAGVDRIVYTFTAGFPGQTGCILPSFCTFTGLELKSPTGTAPIDLLKPPPLSELTEAKVSFNYTNSDGDAVQYATGQITQLGPCSGELLDPVPTLLRGAQVTTDTARLSSAGRAITGISADGTAQAVVRLPALRAGERISVNVLANCLNESDPTTCISSNSIQENGGVREATATAGYCGAQFCDTQPLTAMATSSGPMAFAVYRAPEDFVRSASDSQRSERIVYLEMSFESGAKAHHKIRIVRPPVVLIHGIWGKKSSWDYFDLPFVDSYLASYFYLNFGGASILDNADTVLDQVHQAVADTKGRKQVAASQADIVAHSMGGLVTRTLAILPGFRNPSNFSRGYVHKLITLNTPHRGSPFAVRLDRSSSACKLFLETVAGLIVAEGLRDLRPDSGIIGALATDSGRRDIKAHALRGVASDQQIQQTQASFARMAVSGVCNEVLGFSETFSRDIFPGEAHDLIVGETSMQALSLGIGTAVPSSPIPGAYVHTAIPGVLYGPDVLARTTTGAILPVLRGHTIKDANSIVPAAVTTLLNSPLNSGSFGLIKP